MRAVWIVLGLGLGACGDDPVIDPGPIDPVFDDSRDQVRISEGVWPGVGDPWSAVSAWFSDSPDYLTETMRVGRCRLQVSNTSYCQGCEVGFCVEGVCTPWAEGRSAGPITVTGLAVGLDLTWTNDYYAQSAQPPADLFDAGDAITVTAAGDEVPAFTVAATGVATIRPDLDGACANELHVTRGEDLVVTWRDPVPGARAFLRLPSPNNGHGMPPQAVIECEGADAGRFTVPAALIDALPDLHETDGCAGDACEGHDCPPSSLSRYARGTAMAGAETVELRVQSVVSFYLFDD